MNTKDVRVGNIVEVAYYDDDDNEVWVPATILAIDGTGGNLMEYEFWFGSEANREMYFDNRPVELTEEIILKCGFKEKNYTYRDGSKSKDYWFGNIYLKIDVDCFILCRVIGDMHQYINHVKYLHKLQNIYYELKDEELTVNL